MGQDTESRLAGFIDEFEDADDAVKKAISDTGAADFWAVFCNAMVQALKLAARTTATLGPVMVIEDSKLRRKAKDIREKRRYLTFHYERIILDFINKAEAAKYKDLLSLADLAETLASVHLPEWNEDIIYEILNEANLGLPAEFLRRKVQLGGVVVEHSDIAGIAPIIGRIQSLHLLGQFEAAIILCRTVLEAALRKKLSSVIKSDKVDELEEKRITALWRLFEKNREFSRYTKQVMRVNKVASSIVHNLRKAPNVDESMSLETLRDTFDVLEVLYSK